MRRFRPGSVLRASYRLLLPGFLLLQLQAADYLPLAPGNKWVLRSPYSSEAFTLSVLSAQQSGTTVKAVIDVDNPWYHHAMLVKSTPTGVDLEGIALDIVRYRFA